MYTMFMFMFMFMPYACATQRVHRYRYRCVCTTYTYAYVRVQVPLLCSLNQLPKLDPSLFTTWLNALSRAAASPGPPTRLWLLRFPATAITRLRAEAAAHISAVPATAVIDLPTVSYEARLE